MQDLSPSEYRKFRQAAVEYKMRENGADTEAEIVERYMETAEQEGVTLTRDEVMDELAADFAGDMLDDADLFAKFAKENRTAAQKLLDSLKEFLNKVRGLFTGKYRDMAAQEAYGKDFAELENIAKQWQAAFDAAERQAEKTKTAAGEGDGVRYMIRNVGGETMTVIDTENDTRDFKAAEAYLKTLVDADHPFSTILADAQPVYVGKDLPGEYKSSEYTKTMKPALRKIKMQAATNLDEMLLLAENGEWRENVKPKHSKDAQNGWYQYDTQFAVPILNAKKTIDHYTVYGGTLLIRNDADGKSYLYDLLDIEKKKVISKTSFSAKTHSEVTSPKPSGSMEAFFSSIDDADERGTGIYMVLGHLDHFYPEIAARICCGGSFVDIDPGTVVEGLEEPFPPEWRTEVSHGKVPVSRVSPRKAEKTGIWGWKALDLLLGDLK